MGAASWLGVKFGLQFSKFDDAPEWTKLAPAALNYVCLGLSSSPAPRRSISAPRPHAEPQAVGLVIGFTLRR